MLKMTRDIQTLLENINSDVNREEYAKDLETFGERDNWSPTGKDCDSKAMSKRDLLVAGGVPLAAMGMVVGWTELGGYHAMLGVHTDQGMYILDNRQKWVTPWRDIPGYKWDKYFHPERKVWINMNEQER